MRRLETSLELDVLRDLFTCDPEAGTVTWKPRNPVCYRVATWNKRFSGQVAGRRMAKGYIQIVVTVEGVRHYIQVHRLIWALTFGEWVPVEFEIDHRNTVRDDNRIKNLRVCLPVENAKNRALYKNNSSGFKGVSWVARYGKWGVQIHINGGSKFKGYFDSPADAAAAYDQAALENFREFARTNNDMRCAI
ncbi:HNH endonuclease [Sphingomonas sp. RB3P16]|uniref:HNH endonuclease n=1 Tax=Parasphingomonas frigoris TaxID=3096163 RepID=UPI002FCAC898